MPYISGEKFEKYHEEIKNLLKKLESVEPLSKKKYPDIEDFGSPRKSIGEMASKLVIDRGNEKIVSRNKYLKRSVENCKKNLSNLVESKKNSILGLIHYDKIHTLNWGEVDIQGFRRYLQAGLDIFNLEYGSLDM